MKRLLSIIAFLLIGTLTFGEVTIEVNRNEVSTTQRFNLTISFTNEERSDFVIEGLDDFEIRSRGNSSQHYITNNQRLQILVEDYTLSPKREGDFVIKVLNRGSEVAQVEIKVVEGDAVTVSSEDMEMISSIEGGETYYFGEKIIYTDKFVIAVPNIYFRGSNLPNFGDFSQRNLTGINSNGSFRSNEIISDAGRVAIEIFTYDGILEATSSGEKEITSTIVFLENRDLQEEYRLANENIKITILPLPLENRPNDFQNVVGKLEGDYLWDKDRIFHGESVVLNVRLHGDVNLDQLEAITLNQISPNDFNVFENIISAEEKIIDGKYHSEKTFEVAFIPKEVGEVVTPEIKIPYFNTKTGEYDNFIVSSKELYVAAVSSGQNNSNISDGTNNTSSINNTNNSNNNTSTQNTASQGNNTGAAQQNTTQNNNISISEEIEIETLNLANGRGGFFASEYGIIITVVVILQFLTILYLLSKKKKATTAQKKFVKDLKNANSDREFYDLYCEIMREHFDYTPKAHLEDRLIKNGASNQIVEINREIEESIYSGKALDKNKLIRRLKKELDG